MNGWIGKQTDRNGCTVLARVALSLGAIGVLLAGAAGCISRTVVIRSEPPRASVFVDGTQAGRTPHTRTMKWDSGTVHTVTASSDQYERRTQQLSYEAARDASSPWEIDFHLARVRHEIPVRILCNIDAADVTVDGEIVGQTPVTRKFLFTRSDGAAPWTSYTISVSKDGYRWRRDTESAPRGDTGPFATTLTYEQAQAGELNVELEPIRYVWTKLRYYKFDGETIGIGEELILAQVGEVETEPMVQSVTRMTDRAPDELMDTRLWVAAPEQQLVYSVPFTRPEVTGQLANLWRQVGRGLTRLTDGPFVDMEASVSADGRYAYFSANRLRPDKFNLWRVQMTGQGGFTKITDSPSTVVDTEPMLSPDGSRIVYTSRLRGVEVPQIWTANADGTLPTQLRIGHSPAWSPNGEQILYVASDDDGFRQIWVMNDDGSEPTQLTVGPYQHEHPIGTPDGGRIVYASNEAVNPEGLPNFDIWIMATDGTDRTQLTVNGSWDNRPAISPDGKHIYFLSNRGAKKEYENNWQIWRIELK